MSQADAGGVPGVAAPRILIVKLSSLGDVVHTLPVVQDLLRALPDARIDWVVERGFAPIVQLVPGVQRVIPCELRRWRKRPLAADTRAAWRSFRDSLQEQAYDWVIDLQGLSKSALVAWLARTTQGGRRVAMANRTRGSGYEAPTRWVADLAVPLPTEVHAVDRGRQLCAAALGYAMPARVDYGLAGCHQDPGTDPRQVVLVHGTSRDDKLWPEDRWLALGQRLLDAGHTLGLPHGSDAELARSQQLAQALGPAAQVWPRLPLDALTRRMAGCAGVVGVDSGLSHIAVALDLPHVQLYNFDTAWRTGPTATTGARQCSLFGPGGPAVDAVWAAWSAALATPGEAH